MYTPEQENKIRRAAQQDRVRGAEALFRNRKRPEIDVGAAVKRSVTSAVRSTMRGRSLSPDQFPSPSRDKPLTSRLEARGYKGPDPAFHAQMQEHVESFQRKQRVKTNPSEVIQRPTLKAVGRAPKQKKNVKPREIIL